MARTPAPIHPRRKDEREYNRQVKRRILDPLFKQLIRPLNKAVDLRNQMLMETEYIFNQFDRDVMPQASEELSQDQILKLNRYHKSKLYSTFKSALGVDVRPQTQDLAVRGLLQDRIQENVGLITSIPKKLQGQLLDAYDDTLVKHGFDQQELKKVLQNRFKVTASRAKLITRDQTSKTIGSLTEARHKQLGITGYTWLTAGDERVRESHMALNGTEQTWGIAPSVGHPGHDIQCRCVAIPRID